MIPLKTRKKFAIQAIENIVQRECTLTEILDALEEIKGEIEIMIDGMRDDVEREVGE